MPTGKVSLEPFAPRHAAGILRVIGLVFAEYGMTFDPSGFDADLLDIQRHYVDGRGWFSALTDEGHVVGTVAATPKDEVTCELKRVYLLPEYRGRGLGRALVEHALTRARDTGYRQVIAWSDVRLETAHKVYDRLGFERAIEDIDRSREYGFRKVLTPPLPSGAPGRG